MSRWGKGPKIGMDPSSPGGSDTQHSKQFCLWMGKQVQYKGPMPR